MSKIVWDAAGQHFYETGVDHGVLYVMSGNGQTYGAGVAWNGLTAVTESPEGAEVTAIYADNIKYLNLRSAEDFKATIEAYTYPDEFEECDGSASLAAGIKVGQQTRKTFAFCYRTKVGNELNPDLGYKLHIIYGASAAPSERAYATVNDSPEAITFSWEIETIAVPVTGLKPTAHLEIDSTKVDAAALAAIEAALYGTENDDPRLLFPDEILELVSGQGEHGALEVPTVAADNAAQKLAITGEENAESFDVYEGPVFILNVAKSATPTEVAYASLGFEAGSSHVVKVKAQGAGHEDSEFSAEVTIAVAE